MKYILEITLPSGATKQERAGVRAELAAAGALTCKWADGADFTIGYVPNRVQEQA